MTTSDRYAAATVAASDLLRWRSPLRAELWASRLVAGFEEDEDSERAFVGRLGEDRSPEAALMAAALTAVGVAATAGTAGPGWLARMGRVAGDGAWYGRGDAFGEQVLGALGFRYEDGKEPHVLVVALDQVHGGIAVDATVEEPKFLDDLSLGAEEPGVVAARVLDGLSLRDMVLDAPAADTFAAVRAFARARARVVPGTGGDGVGGPGRPALPDLPGAEEAFGVLAEFVGDRTLWWSPARVSAFLTAWLPREAILSEAAVAAMPEVVRAWTRQAGDEPAVHQQIDLDAPDLPRRMADESLAGLRKRLRLQG
ncbi:hypothetical protein [Nonomuraea typhae]|uniref:Uncharacterized protein n=1 Tax=Nonomuraea typhae TaxID=2603600 RepID=A0ABW7YST6_9ACTN